jgi:hypothetical protein
LDVCSLTATLQSTADSCFLHALVWHRRQSPPSWICPCKLQRRGEAYPDRGRNSNPHSRRLIGGRAIHPWVDGHEQSVHRKKMPPLPCTPARKHLLSGVLLIELDLICSGYEGLEKTRHRIESDGHWMPCCLPADSFRLVSLVALLRLRSSGLPTDA